MIYTKTGDKGKTSLCGGQRVEKSCLDIQVVGELDELNAVLGLVKVNITWGCGCHFEGVGTNEESLKQLKNSIQSIQRDLFKISSEIASLQTAISKKIEKISKEKIFQMERQIDKWQEKLPELKNFIIPGGSLISAHLHLARAICRRAERELVALGKQKKIRSELFKYLNRLSDFLFVGARWSDFV
jgi:cob(I)alamin adenosyltransferase